ncbi:MAG: thioredoxin family protein [Candidatus Melainabacteria bacterium]|nr:thioredoxin family protein [Candidatus Melainabacteria bacterium]
MKNEIKRSPVRTRAARLFVLATVAVAAVAAVVLTPVAQAANDLQWATDLNTGLAQAKGKKYVLADIYTDWCGWCKRLDRDTFADPQMMAYLNTKFVCVKVNAEHANGQPVASKYRVKGFPCALVFDPSGKIIGKLSGYFKPGDYKQALEDLIKHPPSDPLAEE